MYPPPPSNLSMERFLSYCIHSEIPREIYFILHIYNYHIYSNLTTSQLNVVLMFFQLDVVNVGKNNECMNE